jgi:hypothetical protein
MKLVETYIDFMRSAEVHQDPRANTIYGANPQINTKDRKKKMIRLINRLIQNHQEG